MATVLSVTASLTTAAAKPAARSPKGSAAPLLPPAGPRISSAIASLAAAASLLLTPAALPAPAPAPAPESDPSFFLYYGTASSAANYGGYGGNQSKRDTAEYTYEVPAGWKERLVSKVEKGTNGTDSEFFNPRRKAEKEYLTYLAGFRSLAPMDAVLGNLALSDVDLQDLIAGADAVRSEERRDESGQVYYVYEIDGGGGSEHGLISVTCARNKLYAHFVKAPRPDWDRDEQALRRIHQSFRTTPLS